MDQTAKTRLERVVRNMPIVGEPKFRRAKSGKYEVFMAFGRDKEGHWMGVWGAEIGDNSIGRGSIGGDELTEKKFIQGLFDDALWFCKEADKRNMMEAGWWKSGRVR